MTKCSNSECRIFNINFVWRAFITAHVDKGGEGSEELSVIWLLKFSVPFLIFGSAKSSEPRYVCGSTGVLSSRGISVRMTNWPRRNGISLAEKRWSWSRVTKYGVVKVSQRDNWWDTRVVYVLRGHDILCNAESTFPCRAVHSLTLVVDHMPRKAANQSNFGGNTVCNSISNTVH